AEEAADVPGRLARCWGACFDRLRAASARGDQDHDDRDHDHGGDDRELRQPCPSRGPGRVRLFRRLALRAGLLAALLAREFLIDRVTHSASPQMRIDDRMSRYTLSGDRRAPGE